MVKVSVMAGLVAGLMATNAWAGNAASCLAITHPNNTSGQALKNNCNQDVEAAWNTQRGRFEYTWTIHPGQEIPIDTKQGEKIYYDACQGANTIIAYTNDGTVECR